MSLPAVLRFGVVLLMLLTGACATTPNARFFALSAVASPLPVQPSDVSLALGPIDLPEYLDRPQIVTRAGDNQLNVAEFDRWGGSLDEEIGRVLALNLGRRFGGRVYGYPSRIAADTDYRIAVDVRGFDGVLGGDVTLDAAWSLIDDRMARVVQTQQAVYHSTANGADYAGYAAALSDTLGQLSNELAAALASVTAPRP